MGLTGSSNLMSMSGYYNVTTGIYNYGGFNIKYKYTKDNEIIIYNGSKDEGDIKYEIEFDTVEEFLQELMGVSLLESL